MFLPEVPGPGVSRGDVVDPALTVGVQSHELLEPEDEHVGPEPPLQDEGVLRPGDLADIVNWGQGCLSHRNPCLAQSRHYILSHFQNKIENYLE